MSDSLPKTLYEKQFNLLGLIKFQYVLEDRRPDLNEDSEEIKQMGYKYKTQIIWKFFRLKRNLVFRTIYKPAYYLDK
jgi:hypothetical protein